MKKSYVESYLKDVTSLCQLPALKKYGPLVLEEYPFDHQLLSASRLYRLSRQYYLSLGGVFKPSLCSTMRSLSAQDLFNDVIDFTPSFSQLLWFKDHPKDVTDPEVEINAFTRYNEISLYHEQNHRVIWRLLPPAPEAERDVCRYLNFAESLVVAMDVALGDELGKKASILFERLKVIYRSGGKDQWQRQSKKVYRDYLLALVCATYYLLEGVHTEDILKAVNYIFPNQKKMNRQAVTRAFDLSELFTRVTNPEWQARNWQVAQKKLAQMHEDSAESVLYLPDDPLDLEEELVIARDVLAHFGL